MKKLVLMICVICVGLYGSNNTESNGLHLLDSYHFWDQEFYSFTEEGKSKCLCLMMKTSKKDFKVKISGGMEITTYPIIDIEKLETNKFKLKTEYPNIFMYIEFDDNEIIVSYDPFRESKLGFYLKNNMEQSGVDEAFDPKKYPRCKEDVRLWEGFEQLGW